MEEKRNAYRLLVGKPEGKRPLGRPIRRWVDNIREEGEVGWGDVDWIGLAQDRNRWRALVNSVLNIRVPYTAGKLSSGITTGGLSSVQLHRVQIMNLFIIQFSSSSYILRLLIPHVSKTPCSQTTSIYILPFI
jgi:hypothetical protein